MTEPLRKLVAEMHRRSLWQVLGIYLVGAWIGYQVILALTDGIGLPDWVPAFAIVLFVIGLPIVLATAFIQEGAPSPATLLRDPTLLPEGDVIDRTSPLPRMLTWRRSILAGAAAFLVLGTSGFGYVGLRAAGIGPFATLMGSGAMDDRQPVLLTAFASADSSLAGAVTEALRVDLEQSSSVALVSVQRVRDALQRMDAPASSALDAALGATLAEREGISVVLSGDVTPAGSGVILTARLTEVATGNVLASFRESVRNDDDVIAGVNRLSKQVRRKVGESLKDVRRSEPLASVTTHSLQALRLYSQSLPLTAARAVPLVEEAVRIDSTFAMAWRRLAALYSTQADYQRSREASMRAYQLRDRLTERERLMTVGTYHAYRDEDDQAIAAYRTLVDKWPDDSWAVGSLADLYRNLYDYENAAKYYEQRLALDTSVNGVRATLTYVYYRLGDTAKARLHLDEFGKRAARQGHLGWQMHWALADARYEEAEQLALERLEHVNNANQRQIALARLRDALAVQGKFSEVSRTTRELISVATGRAGVGFSQVIGVIGNEVRLRYYHGLPYQEQLKEWDRAVAERWDQLDVLNLPFEQAIEVAMIRQDSMALVRLIDAWNSLPRELVPEATPEAMEWIWQDYAMFRGDVTNALEAHRGLLGACRRCPYRELGNAFYTLGQADSAIHYYERALADRQMNSMIRHAMHRGPMIERLAKLHDAAGHNAEAVRWYAALVEQWREADPILQPRVTAARQRLTELDESRQR